MLTTMQKYSESKSKKDRKYEETGKRDSKSKETFCLLTTMLTMMQKYSKSKNKKRQKIKKDREKGQKIKRDSLSVDYNVDCDVEVFRESQNKKRQKITRDKKRRQKIQRVSLPCLLTTMLTIMQKCLERVKIKINRK